MNESNIPLAPQLPLAEPVVPAAPKASNAWTPPPLPQAMSESTQAFDFESEQVPVTPGPAKGRGAGMLVAATLSAILFGGAAGFGGGYLFGALGTQTSNGEVAGPGVVTVNNPGSVNETTAIAAKVLPSVVTLDVTSSSSTGSGSGVILSADGYILTNAHVVTLGGDAANAAVRVMTSDGRLFDAKVIGLDTIYDLAVIKIDTTGLTPIEWADSDTLNVGDTSVVVGAPLGYANSVTTGIVSALNRSISISSSETSEDGEEDDFQFRIPGQQQTTTNNQRISIAVIQTDAAINPGNSGGALVDSAGRLIGINVAIATTGGEETSGSIGLGFAIPANIANRVASELIANGEATHGLLGAVIQSSTNVAGAQVAGAYINEVSAGGPAEGIGLAEGDIVTMFNGAPITSANDLTAQVRAAAAGSTATITYVRDGLRHTVDVVLGKLVL